MITVGGSIVAGVVFSPKKVIFPGTHDIVFGFSSRDDDKYVQSIVMGT